MPAPEPKPVKEQEEETEYRYMADWRWDPPTLIRLGSFAKMEADMFVYPGVWKDTPRLNDIRVGLGGVLDYDDVSEEEAIEIRERLLADYARIAKEREGKG